MKFQMMNSTNGTGKEIINVRSNFRRMVLNAVCDVYHVDPINNRVAHN